MDYNLIITALLIVSFVLCVNAYILGLKHGKTLTNGNKEPELINPIRPLRTAVELVGTLKKGKLDKDIDESFKAMEDVFNYSADVAMDAIKKEKR